MVVAGAVGSSSLLFVVDLVRGDFAVVVDDFVAVSGLGHVAAVVEEDLVAVCGVGQGGNVVLVLVSVVVVVSVSVSDDVVVLASEVVVVFGW